MKAIGLLEDRCRALEHRCEDMERKHKALELEWEELFDKVKRMMSRISKRVALDKREAESEPQPEDIQESPSGVDSISARIHRRRAGYGAQQ